MSRWLRRARGLLGMGLTWAVAWAVVGGTIMEGLVDPHGRILDMWPQTLAIPGFVGGVAFASLLWITEGRRRFDELSISRFSAWGALVGIVLGVVAVSTGMGRDVLPLWLRTIVIITPLTMFSAASASGTLALARLATRRERVRVHILAGKSPSPDPSVTRPPLRSSPATSSRDEHAVQRESERLR